MKRLRILFCLIIAAGIALCGVGFATPVKFWWTGDRTQNGQMTIFNPTAEDGDTGIPVYSGDLDSDGKMEALLSAMTGDGRLNNKSNCGELHVLFGVDSIRGLVDLANYNGVYSNLCTIWGRSTRDYFGGKTGVGDLDGDDIKDLIVAAPWSDTPGRTNSGEVYIIWGGVHLRNSFWDMADSGDVLNLQVTFIRGAEADDKLGAWLDTGDPNGDGDVDLIIGAPRANGFENDDEHDQTGEVYLLYGPFARSDTIDLANTNHPFTVIFGIDSADQMGNTCDIAELNGDSYDELIISASAKQVARLGDTDVDYPFETGGAGDGPNNSRPECGEVYILRGSAVLPDTINLAAGMPVNSTLIYGAHGIEAQGEPAGDEFGEELNCADINGDGIDDLLCGAFRADGLNNDIPWAGTNYLFYGRHNWPSIVDLAVGLPDSASAMYGGGRDWLSGDSSPLGDLNGDGYFDILGGCVHGAGEYDIYKSGTMRIVYGQPALLPPVIDFANPPDTLYSPHIQGAEVSDLMSYWATSGDFNGDGYWDIITNVMHGDGQFNERRNAGDFYIISGEWITNHPGQPRFLSATSDPDPMRVVLQWHDNEERGQDRHVVYRSTNNGQSYDSVASVPFPQHSYTDFAVTAGQTYEYQLVAVATTGERSNPSYPLPVYVGGSVGNGLPLVVNGLHWSAYGSEVDNFYDNQVLLDGAPYAFWDLYSTNNYPDNIVPLGYGIDSLAEHIFDHPTVLWMANGFDPDTSYDDGDMLYEFGPTLVAYLQSGGRLVVIGKELNLFLSPELQLAFTHTINWGFHRTVTGANYLTPSYEGVDVVRKRTGGPDVTSLPPFSVDNSGCAMYLHTFDYDSGIGGYDEDDYVWMSALSRASILDPYNVCIMSMRPYRAHETDLSNFIRTLLNDLIDHYPAPTDVMAIPTAPGEIMVCWDVPIIPTATGITIVRQRADGTGSTDTLATVPADHHNFFDNPPDSFSEYAYWIFSEHSDGRRSLDSWHVTALSPAGIGNGSLLIVNGNDWAIYEAELDPMLANNVIQGARPFRFWDLFSDNNYPAGYTPVGFGTDSLLAAMWQSPYTIWLANAFNGDEDDFVAMQPTLELYLNSGGNLLVIGKEPNLYLGTELENRLRLQSYLAPVTWVNSDTARGEHPSFRDFGRIGPSMSLCPEFTVNNSPLVYPILRKNLTVGSYIGAAARPALNEAFNLVLISVRPYRAEPVAFRATMETVLSDLLGQTLNDPVDDLTLKRTAGAVQLQWQPIPGATGYRICRLTNLNLPHNFGSVIGETASTTYSDPLPVGDTKRFYVVYPTFP